MFLRKIHHDLGIVSLETLAGLQGYDYNIEKARIEKEPKPELPPMMPGGFQQNNRAEEAIQMLVDENIKAVNELRKDITRILE